MSIILFNSHEKDHHILINMDTVYAIIYNIKTNDSILVTTHRDDDKKDSHLVNNSIDEILAKMDEDYKRLFIGPYKFTDRDMEVLIRISFIEYGYSLDPKAYSRIHTHDKSFALAIPIQQILTDIKIKEGH